MKILAFILFLLFLLVGGLLVARHYFSLIEQERKQVEYQQTQDRLKEELRQEEARKERETEEIIKNNSRGK